MSIEFKYMKYTWGHTYEVAREAPERLYFDPRYWTDADIKLFFTDLQVCDYDTWEKNVRNLTARPKYEFVADRINMQKHLFMI